MVDDQLLDLGVEHFVELVDEVELWQGQLGHRLVVALVQHVALTLQLLNLECGLLLSLLAGVEGTRLQKTSLLFAVSTGERILVVEGHLLVLRHLLHHEVGHLLLELLVEGGVVLEVVEGLGRLLLFFGEALEVEGVEL